MYSLLFSGQAMKGLRKTPAPEASRIRSALDRLAADPSRRDIDARTIEVLRIGPRGSIYEG